MPITTMFCTRIMRCLGCVLFVGMLAAGTASAQGTSNQSQILNEAKLFTDSIGELLENTSLELAEALNDLNSGESDVEEFTDESTQIAADATNDLNEFRLHAESAMTDLTKLRTEFPQLYFEGPVRPIFLKAVKPFVRSHTAQINGVLSQLQVASSRVDPSSTPAHDIFAAARTALQNNTFNLR